MRYLIPLAPALFGALIHGANVPPSPDPAQETFTESSSTRSVAVTPSSSVAPSSSRFSSSTGSLTFSTSSTPLPAVPSSSSEILPSSVPSGVPTTSSTPGGALPSNTPSDVPSGSSISSNAPSTAPSPAPSATPTTTYPPVTVSISTVSGVTTNGHTTTTGPNNQPTLLPIIAPNCWFCPPGDNGWGLGGMTAPGVYPPGPPPPGWPSPWPPITIGPDGNPTYSSTEPSTEPTTSQTTSSSRSCTTETASSCTVSTSYGVNTAGSTTTTFTTTSCSTFNGCSVTGTTSTTVTTSSAPGCWKFPTAYAYATPAPSFARREVGSILEDDAIDGPTDEALLEKRAPKGNRFTLNKLGTCQLQKPIKVPGHDYPGPGKIEAFMKSKNIPFPGAYIVPEVQGVCAPPELTLLSDVSQLSSTQYYNGINYVPMGTAITGKVPYVNTEHVYELKTLPYFFAALIAEGKITCAELNAALFPASGQNYGTDLWSRLPSNQYPAFIALDNTVNNIKGEMLQQNYPSLQNSKANLDDEMAYLFNMALVFEMMRNGQINQWYKLTNARLYQYMEQTLDTSCSNKPPGGFASAYSSWMEEHVQTQAASASTAMTDRYARATAMPMNSQQKFMLQAMTRRYPTASWTFDTNDFLSWPAAGAAPVKRTTCPKTTTTGSSSSPTNPTSAPGGPHSGGPTSTGLHPTTRPQPSSGTIPTPTAPPASSNPSTAPQSSAAPSSYSSSNPSSAPYSSGAPHPSSGVPLPSSGAHTSTGLIPTSQSVPPFSSAAPSPYSSSYPSPAPSSSAAPPPFSSSVAPLSTFQTSRSPVYTQTSTPIPPPHLPSTSIPAPPPPPPPSSISTPLPPPVTTQAPPPPPPPASSLPSSSLSTSIMPTPVYIKRRKIAA